MRTIIVGDVHGCQAELEVLFSAADYGRGDRLIFVGDLVDRGPDSVGAVRFVGDLSEREGAVSLMGNHEVKYVRFHRKVREMGIEAARAAMPGFGAAKVEVYQQLTDTERTWLAERPYYHRGPGFLVVHAGICPRRHRAWADLDDPEYADRLIRLRDVDVEGKMLPLRHRNPDARPWFDAYDGRFGHVFFGHQPRDEVVESAHATGLDTSCCFGGRLTACVFEDDDWRHRRYVTVAAQGRYARRIDEEE